MELLDELRFWFLNGMRKNAAKEMIGSGVCGHADQTAKELGPHAIGVVPIQCEVLR